MSTDSFQPGGNRGQPRRGAAQAEIGSKPPLVPDHELIRRIGCGSYGEVWLARSMVGSYRAIKFVRRDSFEDEKPFERELNGIRKFEPISRVHEGFLDILHVGSDAASGSFYYIMELADDETSGQTIEPQTYTPKTLSSELAHGSGIPLDETVQLGVAVARALSELHSRGLVHRDIKPSNILFVNGKPKLGDIGLIAEAQAARSYVGTEGFIPPEGPGSIQADIYSLGKVLYEASTGKDRQEYPALPTLWESSPDHERLIELNEVIVRACDNDPARRYASTQEMAEELGLVAAGKSVRRLRILERRWKNVKRGVLAFTAIAALVAVASREFYREWRIAANARQQRIGSSVAYGNQAMDSGDLLGSLPNFAEAIQLAEADGKAQPSARLRFGSVLQQCPKVTGMWFEQKQLSSVQFSPDGRHLLLAELYGWARIYDLEAGDGTPARFGPTALCGAFYGPGGKLILTVSQDGFASIWSSDGKREVWHFPHPDRVFGGAFSPDGHAVVTCCNDGLARIWDLETGTLKSTLKGHSGPVGGAAFSHDGRMIVTCGRDGTARLWDAAQARPLDLIIHQGRWITCAGFSPDGRLLVVGSDDHRATVWEVATGRRILPDLTHKDVIRSAQFSPDGRTILTASLDGTVRLWSSKNLQPLKTLSVLRQHTRVSDAAFDEDGRRIVVGCVDGTAQVWDLAAGAAAGAPVARRALFAASGLKHLSFEADSFGVYEFGNSKPLLGPVALDTARERVRLTTDGRFACATFLRTNAGRAYRLARVWDVIAGKVCQPEIALPQSMDALLLSDDGKTLCSYSSHLAQLWDVRTGRAASGLLTNDQPIRFVAFDNGSTRVAIAAGPNLEIRELQTGKEVCPALVHKARVEAAEFTPDDRWIVTCCSDDLFTRCYAQVWDAGSGRPAGPALYHRDGVLWACFSPDENM